MKLSELLKILRKNNVMAKYIYPAIFEREDDYYNVSFPDLPGCNTFGKGLQQSFDMAEDALALYLYDFEEHDQTVAYSLSIPFISTFAFAAVMKHQDAPGTTFKRHMQIAKGVLSEDDTLLREILFNPYTKGQVEQIRTEMKEIIEIIDTRDEEHMQKYLTKIRKNIK